MSSPQDLEQLVLWEKRCEARIEAILNIRAACYRPTPEEVHHAHHEPHKVTLPSQKVQNETILSQSSSLHPNVAPDWLRYAPDVLHNSSKTTDSGIQGLSCTNWPIPSPALMYQEDLTHRTCSTGSAYVAASVCEEHVANHHADLSALATPTSVPVVECWEHLLPRLLGDFISASPVNPSGSLIDFTDVQHQSETTFQTASTLWAFPLAMSSPGRWERLLPYLMTNSDEILPQVSHPAITMDDSAAREKSEAAFTAVSQEHTPTAGVALHVKSDVLAIPSGSANCRTRCDTTLYSTWLVVVLLFVVEQKQPFHRRVWDPGGY